MGGMNSYGSSGRNSTFAFADLAGFTALTEAHGDERAATLATEFCTRIRERVTADDEEVVKTIGDAALIRFEDAARAVRFALAVVEEEGQRLQFPAVRVGMHSGPAVEREGDWFGNTVNVAARVAAVAAAGEVLLTKATLDLAEGLDDVVIERMGSRELRNVSEPVVLLRASHKGAHAGNVIIDPVCRMRIADQEWVGSLTFEGKVFHFCSMACAERFAAGPEHYAAAAMGKGER